MQVSEETELIAAALISLGGSASDEMDEDAFVTFMTTEHEPVVASGFAETVAAEVTSDLLGAPHAVKLDHGGGVVEWVAVAAAPEGELAPATEQRQQQHQQEQQDKKEQPEQLQQLGPELNQEQEPETTRSVSQKPAHDELESEIASPSTREGATAGDVRTPAVDGPTAQLRSRATTAMESADLEPEPELQPQVESKLEPLGDENLVPVPADEMPLLGSPGPLPTELALVDVLPPMDYKSELQNLLSEFRDTLYSNDTDEQEATADQEPLRKRNLKQQLLRRGSATAVGHERNSPTPPPEEQAEEGRALALLECDPTAAYNAFAEALMADLGSKFPALGSADRLRLVERAWGQGYRWWVKAARALQAQAVVAYDRKHAQANVRQEQDKHASTRRRLPQRVASPVIQVTATGEIAVAGIDPAEGPAQAGRQRGGVGYRRGQPPRGPATESELTRKLQNVYGDHATVSQLRQVLQSVQIAQPPTELLKTHARLRKQSGRPERGEYLERNGDTYATTRAYHNDAALQKPGDFVPGNFAGRKLVDEAGASSRFDRDDGRYGGKRQEQSRSTVAQDNTSTVFPPISRHHIPVQLRKNKPKPPPVDLSSMPSIYSAPADKNGGGGVGWPSGVTMCVPSARGDLAQRATAIRVDVGIAIPNAEPAPPKRVFKALDKDGLTEIGERHRGMSGFVWREGNSAAVSGLDRHKQRRTGSGVATQQPAVSRAEKRAAAQQAAAAARGGAFWVPRVDHAQPAQASGRSDIRDDDTKHRARVAVPPSENRPAIKATARSGFRLQKARGRPIGAVEAEPGRGGKVEGTPRAAEASII